MATILHSGISTPSACPYLPDRDHQMDNRVMIDVPPDEVEVLLERGWRRFGPHYFRPACHRCDECLSIRIPVDRFRPSKSQRRALRKCAGLRVVLQHPHVDQGRLALYAAWHAERERSRGWQSNPLDAEAYRRQFCYPHPCAREMAYYDGPRLIGIGIVDETPSAISSVYFFYHPDYRDLSLGIASVLFEVETARMRGRRYVYLGYGVSGCQSLQYKGEFRPHEVLGGRPSDQEKPNWRTVE